MTSPISVLLLKELMTSVTVDAKDPLSGCHSVRLFRPHSPLLIALILAKLPEGWRETTEWIKTLNN